MSGPGPLHRAGVTRNPHTRQRKTASQRSVVLVTGMSGTGKSSALALLARHGHDTVDTDEPGWIIQGQTPDGSEPLRDLDRVGALLDRHRAGWLFIAGCVANQRELYECFDAVVLLSAPIDVLLERVTDRGNPFGSTSEDRAKIASRLRAPSCVQWGGACRAARVAGGIPVEHEHGSTAAYGGGSACPAVCARHGAGSAE